MPALHSLAVGQGAGLGRVDAEIIDPCRLNGT